MGNQTYFVALVTDTEKNVTSVKTMQNQLSQYKSITNKQWRSFPFEHEHERQLSLDFNMFKYTL